VRSAHPELGDAFGRHAERALALAARESRQEALVLLGRSRLLDHRAREHARQKRDRRDGAAELFAQDRELDASKALAPVALGERDARPAELAQLAPQLLVAAMSLGVLAHALGTRALGEQLASRALDLALVVGEAEVHGALGRDLQARQAEHALGDDALEHLGGAALDRVAA